MLEVQERRRPMTLSGTVTNGVIVLDQPTQLQEGTRVRVIVENEENTPTLAGLLKFAGVLADMPSDFAQQHDHYVHGTPKR
jgi:predicted DNA-binding antitoxin AbrB/MazE fold protein